LFYVHSQQEGVIFLTNKGVSHTDFKYYILCALPRNWKTYIESQGQNEGTISIKGGATGDFSNLNREKILFQIFYSMCSPNKFKETHGNSKSKWRYHLSIGRSKWGLFPLKWRGIAMHSIVINAKELKYIWGVIIKHVYCM